MTTLDETNAPLRAAVAERMASTPADDPKMVGYKPPSTNAYTLADFGSPCERKTCQDSKQTEPYSEWRPPAYAAQVVVGEDVLREWAEFTRDEPRNAVHPTSQAFFDLCDALKEMHSRKGRDYGCPSGTDPLANIRNGAKFVGIPAWKAAMVRLSDKVTRLATYNATGSLSNESVEDNLFDLAGYAFLALLLHREERDA